LSLHVTIEWGGCCLTPAWRARKAVEGVEGGHFRKKGTKVT
jgi:hypothetical protein